VSIEEAIRRGFELFNARDWDRLARGFSPEFEAIDHVPPDELRAHGPDALKQITDANGDAAFADLRMEAVEVRTARAGDDVVLVAVRVRAQASGGTSGVELQDEIGQTWTFRSGAPTRMEQFRSWDEAQSAAGLAL